MATFTRSTRAFAAAVFSCGLVACSPVLDWREFVPEDSGIRVNFPCRPDRHARDAALESAKVRMTMLVCTAGNATYALSFFDVADPARVTQVLADWRAAAIANVEGAPSLPVPFAVKGMTANDQAMRVHVTGRLPDGSTVQEHAAFFVRGLRVYQAAIIGAAPDGGAVETFLVGLGFPG